MRRSIFAATAMLGMATCAYSAPLPATYAPSPQSFVMGDFQQGATGSIDGVRRSPFEGTSEPDRPYDVVFGNGNPNGIGATFLPSVFGGSSGSAGTFKFFDGSPDSYNVLVFNLVGGGTKIFQGDAIATPTSGLGYQIVTLTDIGAYKSVSFGSVNTNAFEFAALTTVPLPASAPMFGVALLVVGAAGYGMKREKTKAAPNRA